MGLDLTLIVEKRTPEGWQEIKGLSPYCRAWTMFRFLNPLAEVDPEAPPGFDGIAYCMPPDASLSLRHDVWRYLCTHSDPPAWEDFCSAPVWPSCSCLDDVCNHVYLRDLLAYDWAQAVRWSTWVEDRDQDRFPDGGRAAHLQRQFDSTGIVPITGYDYLHKEGFIGDGPFEHVEFDLPLWDAVSPEFLTMLLEMTRLADGDLDSVRLIYYFS
ncbi:hypothetical protein [Actinomadura macrotermitis]|uniref:Uncharacterized protein n=1 Tax=Actinomadura macrotermitis TaxID=2585200 RepID=A0A7K0BXD7_9ACTN|nr:hypothetical protein [Actinomadura macrotermitis]MQY05847.1 hypothetical protein [Actinomadura macrotermitis]